MFFRRKRLPPSLTDQELVEKYRSTGDKDLVGELFNRYTHLVFGVCMKYLKHTEDSRDSVMQIFEKLMVDLKRHKVDNFKSWLYMVAKNHCLMQLRKSSPIHIVEDVSSIENHHVETEDDLHLVIKGEENAEVLQKAISVLKEEQRICVELFFLQEKSYKEVADITGFSMNQVKSFIQNGKRNLKIFILEQNGQGLNK